MTKSEEEIINALKEAHRRLVVYEDPDFGLMAFRYPNRPEWRGYTANRADEATRPIANEKLVQLLVVHPSASAFDAILDEYPGLAVSIANDLSEKVGVKALQGKKL